MKIETKSKVLRVVVVVEGKKVTTVFHDMDKVRDDGGNMPEFDGSFASLLGVHHTP